MTFDDCRKQAVCDERGTEICGPDPPTAASGGPDAAPPIVNEALNSYPAVAFATSATALKPTSTQGHYARECNSP